MSRNRDYDFATTAWSQRNKFLELHRQHETKTPLQIDEIELHPREEAMRQLCGE